MKIGVTPDAGPAYILNAQRQLVLRTDAAGADNTLQTDFGLGAGSTTARPMPPSATRRSARSTGTTIDFFAPDSGLFRALDVAAPEYQGGQDFIGAWNPSLPTAQFLPGFPAPVDDLQFLTGPAIGQIVARARSAGDRRDAHRSTWPRSAPAATPPARRGRS